MRSGRNATRAHDAKNALLCWRPGGPSALTGFFSEVRELLDADFVGAYRPNCTENGWSIDFVEGAGMDAAAAIRGLRRHVTGLPRSETFLGYSPYCVPAIERNRVLTLAELGGVRRGMIAEGSSLLRAVGASGRDQLRVLLCRGPHLEGWFGATRAEPFVAADAALLNKLASALRDRLVLERQLGTPRLGYEVMEAIIEAIGRPAFLARVTGGVELANRAGRALLQRDPRAVLERIREAAQRGAVGARLSITRVKAPGSPDYLLAIEKKGETALLGRLAYAQGQWALTARQTRVLELVATGGSNKEIAQYLQCAEVTVENHLTELFRRSGARSRAHLVALLFTAID